MEFRTYSSPHLPVASSVSAIMVRVLLALIPGTACAFWMFGWGILINILLAALAAIAAEAGMLLLRKRPLKPALLDCSALLTGVLLALALPPLAPWWIPVIGSLFAIVIAKQLYGGLGYNPFNPAMAGYVVLLISFPLELTLWTPVGESLQLGDTLALVFSGQLPANLTLDAITMATPMDTIKTRLGLSETLGEIRGGPLFGSFAGAGWEWINAWFLLGGLWLLQQKVIQWQIPAGMLGGLSMIALLFYVINPDIYSSPLFHLFSGAAMLGAFFIATDPVSASTTPHGRLYYAAGIGILTYIIRTWGGYPDGVAFAVLLMNMAAPTIDYYTRPVVYGHDE
ncbi:MAG: electron transport complex subunit RsxD [Gammaproteobacteria bacterium]|jgi:electron transport complex protein RnfD